jgi:hypothetical protein
VVVVAAALTLGGSALGASLECRSFAPLRMTDLFGKPSVVLSGVSLDLQVPPLRASRSGRNDNSL